MIPAEAVEAAAKEFAAVADPLGDWERQTPGYHRHYFVMAKRILEAAAPHMLKQGWDEGYKAGLFDKEYYSHNPNPYMLNNEGEK